MCEGLVVFMTIQLLDLTVFKMECALFHCSLLTNKQRPMDNVSFAGIRVAVCLIGCHGAVTGARSHAAGCVPLQLLCTV